MAQITVFTAERMLDIEANTVVDGLVDSNGDLILTKHDGSSIVAGPVIGPAHEILIASKPATDAPSAYPVGISTFTYGSGNAQGFPASLGTVFTYVESISRGFQIITEKGADKYWMRTISADDVWGKFLQLATLDGDTLTVPKVRVTATGDANETGTGHGVQIGPDNGVNMILDQNEIMVRDNSSGTPVGARLYVQEGLTQDAAKGPTAAGHLTTKQYVDDLVIATELGANVNLNTLTTQGVFTQSASAEAPTSLNYPRGIAGVLEVVAANATHVWQRYTPYGSAANEVYIRTLYGGNWSAWFRTSATQFATGVYASATAIAAGSGAQVSVTFPSGRFSAPPRVFAVPTNSSRLNVAVINITATGCTVNLDNFTSASASARDFNWMAIQET